MDYENKSKEELINELRDLQHNFDSLKATYQKDMAGREQVEILLRESEERFSKAYMITPISFMIANMEDGRIVEVNDAFTKNFGFHSRRSTC